MQTYDGSEPISSDDKGGQEQPEIARRRWSRTSKEQIVAETLRPGVRVVDVARQHGLKPQQITRWRREILRSASESEPKVSVNRVSVDAVHTGDDGATIEIEAGGVVVRLAGDSPASRIAEIAAALRARN